MEEETHMNISRLEKLQIRKYNLEQLRIQEKREADYRKLVERRHLERLDELRVAKNRRMELDKGRNIDIEC